MSSETNNYHKLQVTRPASMGVQQKSVSDIYGLLTKREAK